jgi:hypothetical protein
VLNFLIAQWLSPAAMFTAAIASLLAMRLFSRPFLISPELVAGFFSSWLLKPIAVYAVVDSAGVQSDETVSILLALVGALLGATAFAVIGILTYIFIQDYF